MKRLLVGMRKAITPQRDMFASLMGGVAELPGMTDEDERYFRDIYDHLIRISDLIDTYRDLLTSSMDVYLSTVSNRLNAVMKQLTIMATVFLPLTFITGFFGQNFGWMVGHIRSGPPSSSSASGSRSSPSPHSSHSSRNAAGSSSAYRTASCNAPSRSSASRRGLPHLRDQGKPRCPLAAVAARPSQPRHWPGWRQPQTASPAYAVAVVSRRSIACLARWRVAGSAVATN